MISDQKKKKGEILDDNFIVSLHFFVNSLKFSKRIPWNCYAELISENWHGSVVPEIIY